MKIKKILLMLVLLFPLMNMKISYATNVSLGPSSEISLTTVYYNDVFQSDELKQLNQGRNSVENLYILWGLSILFFVIIIVLLLIVLLKKEKYQNHIIEMT